MGILANAAPPRGLPRGSGSLPPEQVAAIQRERLMRAMVATVAETGYSNLRIGDVVERARVSKHSFYAQFPDKEQCFLAAHAHGVQVILEKLGQWAADNTDPDPRAQLRGALRTYFNLVTDEPEFARCMLIELQAISRAGLIARVAAHQQIATVLRVWHEHARTTHPDWPAVPASRYPATVGAVNDLLFTTVATGTDQGAETLEVDAVDAVLTLLQIPTT